MIYACRDWLFKIKAQRPFVEDVAQSPKTQEDVRAKISGPKNASELSWSASLYFQLLCSIKRLYNLTYLF